MLLCCCVSASVLLSSFTCRQVILAEDILAASPGQLVAIKVLRRQHALAGQRVGAALPDEAPAAANCNNCRLPLLLLPLLPLQYCLLTPSPSPFPLGGSLAPTAAPKLAFVACCLSGQLAGRVACWWMLQEARALRYLHAAAPGGTAPGVAQLRARFTLGAHYCLVTGGC